MSSFRSHFLIKFLFKIHQKLIYKIFHTTVLSKVEINWILINISDKYLPIFTQNRFQPKFQQPRVWFETVSRCSMPPRIYPIFVQFRWWFPWQKPSYQSKKTHIDLITPKFQHMDLAFNKFFPPHWTHEFSSWTMIWQWQFDDVSAFENTF